ncbi:protein rep, partial [Salmonella enterica subsp. enterica serovar Kentucky]|nr:protein rep [Salmonella enterica subsp. enterica serovar Kentucky]
DYDPNVDVRAVKPRKPKDGQTLACATAELVRGAVAETLKYSTSRYRWQELDGAPRVTEHDTSDGEHYRFDYDFAAGTTTVTGRQG